MAVPGRISAGRAGPAEMPDTKPPRIKLLDQFRADADLHLETRLGALKFFDRVPD
jgi:hypothetical protein